MQLFYHLVNDSQSDINGDIPFTKKTIKMIVIVITEPMLPTKTLYE